MRIRARWWGMAVAALVVVQTGQAVALAPPLTAADPSAPLVAGEWPEFKRDLAHTGRNTQLSGRITASSLAQRWATQLTQAGSRAAGGPVIGRINGRWEVFVAVCRGGNGCDAPISGKVVALDGRTGDILWQTPLPGTAQSDPYAPLLADVDADGRRELIVPANNRNKVFALRTEDEPGGRAGSIQWTFTFDVGWTSEAAPTAANIDTSDASLEVLIGTDSRETGQPARFYAINGATGHLKGKPFEALRRRASDSRCNETNKIDSSAPAVATVGGSPKVFVGAWDGHFYALEWRTQPEPGLYKVWDDPLPLFAGGSLDCSIRKVRNGAAIGQIVPGGDPEVVFGYMAEPNTDPDYPTARLRVLDANGLGLIADAAIPDWKSSPSIADLLPGTPGLEIAGGRYMGVYAARVTPSGELVTVWDKDVGDGNGGFGGNRSSPAIADIDGDGALEVLVGIEGGVRTGLRSYDGASGALEWRFPVPVPGIDGSPAVGDIDGDGRLEVVFFGIDGKLYALDRRADVP